MTTDTQTVAPVAAPAAAPVAAAPAPVAFVSTGDAAMDMALGFFAKNGVAQDSLAMTQAKSGDYSVLAAVLQEKGVQGADAYVEIAKQSHARAQAADQAAEATRSALLHNVMGGEAQWLAVKEFVAQHATADELKEINAGLKAGGVVAKSTAMYLKSAYEKANGAAQAAPQQDAPAPRATSRAGGSAGAAAVSALSPDQFKAEVKALVVKYGASNADRTPEYAALMARRQAYRG